MCKIYHGISPTIMNEIYTLRHQNQYSIKNWTYFDVPEVKTVNHGSESVRYLGPKFGRKGNQNLVHVDYAKSIYKI